MHITVCEDLVIRQKVFFWLFLFYIIPFYWVMMEIISLLINTVDYSRGSRVAGRWINSVHYWCGHSCCYCCCWSHAYIAGTDDGRDWSRR